ncbi:hypothetical protein D9756_004617 [Leucocoprinus leucothites]|uniref:Nephrocystin 3-like N-terminal domain-containing protein n=1 Tax=Leucocoprinus leucothites TaxID=201217 RepID=A0A8H5G9E2_9AGAR|nr:hypothetical protein D9756_004617 [Leucoagaricus leucothites]
MTSILSGAKDLVLNACDFIDNSVIINETVGLGPGSGDFQNSNDIRPAGIQRLLKQSMPDAFHDSSALVIHHPPGDSESPQERVLWMDGPAGVGKSAVAQSCAELFAEQGRLAASIFFSRPNRRQDHNRLFTSISYQIATNWKPFADIVDLRIREDPTLVTKTMREQFLKLLVNPLQQLQSEGRSYAGGKVIVLDGLDECDTPEAQIDIVEIVAMSVRNQMTPFQWIFASRPERHLLTIFTSTKLQPLTFHLNLPVSRKSDHDILLYLTDEMSKVRQQFGLSESWPSEVEYAVLVDLSDGLFVYAATAIRFIGGHRSVTGPVKRLQMVLRLANKAGVKAGAERPLAALDVFYSLIMQNIPPDILPTLQKILLLYEVIPKTGYIDVGIGEIVKDMKAIYISNILKLSELQFQSACSPLSSVLQVIATSWRADLAFYHTSFMDFLADPTRSEQFSVLAAIEDLRLELLEYLNVFHTSTEGAMLIIACF